MKFNKAFWKWFGKSKVVDEKGNPLVVYHGTSTIRNFSIFQTESEINPEMGSHFGTARQAEQVCYKMLCNRRIYPVYLSIQKPFRMTDGGSFFERDVLIQMDQKGIISPSEADKFYKSYDDPDMGGVIKEFLSVLGYDGIVYLNRREGFSKRIALSEWSYATTDKNFQRKYPEAEDSWIAFFPWQIKSVFNSGKWSPQTGNIMNPRRR